MNFSEFRVKALVNLGLLLGVAATCLACTNKVTNHHEVKDQWQPLLDSSLSQWEIWMGVPHTTVSGLAAGTFQADNLNQHGNPKRAMGLNTDVKNVFKMIEQDGQPVLHISGEIYGGLTTKAEFENYHLSLQVKWGDKKWAPRLTAKRDSGLLFHCKGPHGAFWKVWKACQELQIQETDFGDYIPLAGPSGMIRSSSLDGKPVTYDPGSETYKQVKGYSHASKEPDLPNGQWNTVELYTLNDNAVFVVNGEVVMVVEKSVDKQGNPLTSGQLQLQSEGAELFYRDVKIKPLSSLPASIARAARLY